MFIPKHNIGILSEVIPVLYTLSLLAGRWLGNFSLPCFTLLLPDTSVRKTRREKLTENTKGLKGRGISASHAGRPDTNYDFGYSPPVTFVVLAAHLCALSLQSCLVTRDIVRTLARPQMWQYSPAVTHCSRYPRGWSPIAIRVTPT